ncbi:MAG: hypothetical protein AB1815_13950 [Bacillota bacterium]
MEDLQHIQANNNRSSSGGSWLSAFISIFMAYWREAKRIGVIYYHD